MRQISNIECIKASSVQGLTDSQVAQRVSAGETNVVKRTVGKSYWAIIVDNILTIFNLIGLIVFILMIISKNWGNAFFYVIILANTLIGVGQEIKAKLAVNKLSLLVSPTITVVRNGQEQLISLSSLVLDDVIVLSSGKQIPADCVVISGSVEVNEAMLTGESLPISKSIDDSLMSGSFIMAGVCHARVEHVGKHNYVEQLASQAKKFKKTKSELMVSISRIIKVIAILTPLFGIGTFLVSYIKFGNAWQDAIAVASGSVIGMIPAGMVLLTSVTLAVSVIKMARKKAWVKDLYSIETLARVNCLCLDKTGTITDGTMSVEQFIPLVDNPSLFSYVSTLLSATMDSNDTAKALRRHFNDTALPFTSAMPFSSDRKYSSVTIEGVGQVLLGAPEFILQDISDELSSQLASFTSLGLRVLVVAIKQDNSSEVAVQGIITLLDNIRPDAQEIIQWFYDNSVDVKIISGDNAQTVSIIAGKVGVVGAEKYISLDGLTDAEVCDMATKYTVFGRVKPHQKALLISTLKKFGLTVAMTGDGVNDILAMKQADCAISVASGSEASHSVAHIILMDNKFSSLPKIVSEGRQVVNNIQNSSALFLMKTVMTLIVTLFTLVLGINYPFEPMHLYVVDFCVIGIPAFFLALRPNKNLIRGKFLTNTLYSTLPKGIALGLSVIGVYAFNFIFNFDHDSITTTAMLAMSYSGAIGLFALCRPFNLVNLAVAVISLVAMTFYFLAFDYVFENFIKGFDETMLFYVVCSVLVSAVIIVVGNIVTKKLKRRGMIHGTT
ncbi:MAG: HAD-IC family P-type ATPase [Clostridia bacterium]